MRKQLTQADKDEANHLTRMIEAYSVLIDEADSIEEAEALERKVDEMRKSRNRLIW